MSDMDALRETIESMIGAAYARKAEIHEQMADLSRELAGCEEEIELREYQLSSLEDGDVAEAEATGEDSEFDEDDEDDDVDGGSW